MYWHFLNWSINAFRLFHSRPEVKLSWVLDNLENSIKVIGKNSYSTKMHKLLAFYVFSGGSILLVGNSIYRTPHRKYPVNFCRSKPHLMCFLFFFVCTRLVIISESDNSRWSASQTVRIFIPVFFMSSCFVLFFFHLM